MERVGIVVLSIIIATAIVVGASYGAIWLQPILLDIPTIWMIVVPGTLLSLGYLLSRRRHKRARISP